VKRNTDRQQHQHDAKQYIPTNAQPRLPPTGGGHGLKTRTRSTSPLSQRKSKSTSKINPKPKASKSKQTLSSFRRKPSQKRIQPKISQVELSLRKHYFKKTFTFQSPQPLYTCRTIDLKARAAFERKPYLTSKELREMAKAQLQSEGGSGSNTSNSAIRQKLRKMSPSVEHLDILNAMDDAHSIRQICWSPAVSPEADPFYGWGDDDCSESEGGEEGRDADVNANGNGNVNVDTSRRKKEKSGGMGNRSRRRKMLLAKRRRESAAKRVGKYRRVDPVKYIRNTLPDHQPLLTNIRRRLPMRSDVGFPRATEEEIILKQKEIAHEAQLEEISPRLIVLLNSDDLGTLPDLTIDEMMERSGVKEECALPGLPFATSVLLMAKQTPSAVRSNRVTSKQGMTRKAPKPDIYSIFAPPLDATSSSTEIWRPRPFSDRPAGLMHSLVAPVNVSFGVGNIEPLVCTLSLYCIPKHGTDTSYRGKISEDFVFPAGDWKDMLNEKAGKLLAQQFGMTGEPSDKTRVKKALFSYDPLALPMSGNDDGRGSLYLFMQVQKVSHLDADEAYVDDLKGSNSSQFMGFSMRGSKRDQAGAEHRAKQAFDTFGTQFLTPFCFGVLPLFPKQIGYDQFYWPRGSSQTMQLFSFLHMNESEEDFFQKLLAVTEFIDENPAVRPDLEVSMASAESESFDSGQSLNDSISRITSSEDGGKKSRRFRGLKGKRSKFPQTFTGQPADVSKLNGLTLIDGSATFYTSMMGNDFSQCLLQSPEFLNSSAAEDFPQLLVDSSGDCAIMLNPNQQELTAQKRSDLIRLPPSTDSSGYANSSEVREILYLPPNSNTIQIPGHGPHCNFLYLYPLLLINERDGKKGCCHSVRIRFVRQVVEGDKGTKTYKAAQAIYNPSCAGETMLQAVYTKIPLCATHRKSNTNNRHVYMKDEIKVRLPEVLDASHFIQFSLYSIEINSSFGNESGGLKQSLVAETLIPLSSSATKEAVSSTKVSTVIPDGVHRIKLSQFQLEVQSRLVSKVHISDPSVAAIVKELTTDENDCTEKYKMAPYSNVLSKASNDSIMGHFDTLLFLHLRRLVDQGEMGFDFRTGKVVENKMAKKCIENLKNLMELILKLKECLASKNGTIMHIKSFLKCAFDSFDDTHFQHNNGSDNSLYVDVDGADNLDDSIDFKDHDESLLVSFETANEATMGSYEQNPATSQSNLYPLSSRVASADRAARLRQAYIALNSSAPLNRKAYGVSKTDRMKAEAELYESSHVFTELVDDDETVVTTATWHSQARFISASMSVATPMARHPDSGNTVVTETVYTKDLNDVIGQESKDSGLNIESPFEKAKEIAKRVNTVARVFVQPCVAPNIGSTKFQAPTREKLSYSKKIRELHETDPRIKSLREQLAKSSSPAKHLIYEGSDDEKDNPPKGNKGKLSKLMYLPNQTLGVLLRGRVSSDPFEVSLTLGSSADSREPYFYEIIFTFWLHAFSRRLSQLESEKSPMDIDPQMFLRSMDFLLPLCLKSLALRCSYKDRKTELISSTVLDLKHLDVLDPLIAHIGFSLVLSASDTDGPNFNRELSRSLARSDAVVDFFVGLLSVVHPAQSAFLITRYFRTLNDCEEYSLDHIDVEDVRNLQYLQRICVCRHLRLRAAEKLSNLPRFAALNFPFKYHPNSIYNSNEGASWINQNMTDVPNSGSPIMDPPADDMLPQRHWLAELLLNECFAVCLQSCEAIVVGTVSLVKTAGSTKTRKKQSAMRQRISLSTDDITRHYSIAFHAVTIAYETILRKQAMNVKYQAEGVLNRVAGMFLAPVVSNTIGAVSCLSKMEAGNKIRCTWLLCLVYVLQEAPEVSIRSTILSLCDKSQSRSKDSQAIGFLNTLRLSVSSFQGFASNTFTSQMAPWLIQESFNTISAASIVLVDECCDVLSSRDTFELKDLTEGVLDLLLQIISTPLSSVTLLRASGAVSHVLDKVGAKLFLLSAGDSLQHWGRILFGLMNSQSLSVRTMAVDLMVSLFGSVHKEGGSIDEVTQIFITVLPESVAREIALYGESRLLHSAGCVERSMWPLRRALADIEDTDPLDDDRVDASLQPFLKQFCRVSQAVIDGVLIELRLMGNDCVIMGSSVTMLTGTVETAHDGQRYSLSWTFDADEESVFEAAAFFSPETSPVQKLRWLLTLKRLHEFKGHWVEAAETLIICARTVADAIPHISNLWKPSFYKEWKSRKDVSAFSDEFLEPSSLRVKMEPSISETEKSELLTPSIASFCNMLIVVSREAVKMYDKESRMVPLAYSRLQEVLKLIMGVVEDYSAMSSVRNVRRGFRMNQQNYTQDMAALRQASAIVNELVTKLAERMHLIAGDDSLTLSSLANLFTDTESSHPGAVYVRVILYGKKTKRFEESTTIPTFLDWANPYICRVPGAAVTKALKHARGRGKEYQESLAQEVCKYFAEPLVMALREEMEGQSIEFRSTVPSNYALSEDAKLYLIVTPVSSRETTMQNDVQSKRFQVRTSTGHSIENVIDITVAKLFPCALSRQPSLVTTERISSGSFL